MIDIFGIPSTALFGQLLIGLINGSFYALLSLGLAVIFGMLNIINFTHGAQYMMGAFAAFLLLQYTGLGYWPALVVAPILVGIVGMIIERTMLQWLYKLDHLYGLLLTFGLALIIEGLARNYYGSAGLPYQMPEELVGGYNLGFMRLPTYRAWVIAASLMVCLATWFVIERTKLGSYLRAATENPTLVGAFGIDVPRMITLTYGFGVGLAAFAGVMAAPIYNVSPQMGSELIIVVFAVVVIGGMGSILGAVVTGFGLGVIEGLTKVFFPEASNTVIFVIMAIVAGTSRWFRRRPMERVDPSPWQRPSPPCLSFGATERTSCVLADGGGARHRAGLHLSVVRDAGAVLCAVCLRVQPFDRLRRAVVVRPCALFRLGQLSCGACRQGMGLSARARHPHRHVDGRRPWSHRRLSRHPAPGHLFCHDHAGACADDVFLRLASEIHWRRGRHPSRAARHVVWPRRSQQSNEHVRHGAGDLSRRCRASPSGYR
jgi:branched-chain amino acid transport system permease protein